MNANGLAVARVLGRCGVSVYGIHPQRDVPEVRTRFLRELWLEDKPLWELLLEKGPQFERKPVLFPITDASVEAVASHLEALREHYLVAMPRPELVHKLLDKRGFGELAVEMGLPAPRTWFVDGVEAMERAAGEIKYPCIMKPQLKNEAYEAAGGAKAYVLEDASSLQKTYAGFAEASPEVIVQQYVPGGDDEVYFCLQYLGADHEPRASFCGRKLRQWRPHCGGTASCEPVDVPELEELTASFFRRVKMVGLASMEFKRDPRDGAYYMIEPTVCRTDWQSALADHNGVPLPRLAYCDLAGEPPPKVRRRLCRTRWVHLNSDMRSAEHYRTRGELGWIAWLWSIRPPVRGAYWALDDPVPFLAIFGAWLRRGMRKALRIVGLGGKKKESA